MGLTSLVPAVGPVVSRPTLLHSCAHAATAREARYRINRTTFATRSVRVVALDEGALDLLTATPLMQRSRVPLLIARPNQVSERGAETPVSTLEGVPVALSHELADVDFVLLVATGSTDAAVAVSIGEAAIVRGITVAGVVVIDPASTTFDVVSALRPYARVLLVSQDPGDVDEILASIGA